MITSCGEYITVIWLPENEVMTSMFNNRSQVNGHGLMNPAVFTLFTHFF